MAIVDEIVSLYRGKGGDDYGDEPVTQLEHALQCACLARRAGAAPATIAAALLHDIGHLLEPEGGGRAIERGEDARHEVAAHNFLRPWFPSAVTDPIRWHVDAKRYLVATDGAAYRATLSRASLRSLEVQGGPFRQAEAAAFAARPFAAEAVRVRRWDDGAKTPGAATPPLEAFRGLLTACIAPASM